MADAISADVETAVATLLSSVLRLQLGERRIESSIAATLGLTQSDVLALALLVRESGLRVGRIASSLDITPGSASLLVSRLVAAGLVRRVPSTTDRRSVRIEATDRGVEIVRGVRDQYADAIRSAVNGVTVTADCLMTTAKVLRGTAERLGAEVAAGPALRLAR